MKRPSGSTTEKRPSFNPILVSDPEKSSSSVSPLSYSENLILDDPVLSARIVITGFMTPPPENYHRRTAKDAARLSTHTKINAFDTNPARMSLRS
jgi:hypothetical protein